MMAKPVHQPILSSHYLFYFEVLHSTRHQKKTALNTSERSLKELKNSMVLADADLVVLHLLDGALLL